MEIQQIGAIQSTLAGATATGGTATDVGRAFTDLLASLAQTERSTDALVQRAAAGDAVDIHDVMIATQAESLAFQVGLQVRNKLVEAYHEIFRMQM
jgi:flagellar hook-basal body complex protein FliE